ncbi:MAG: PKD domain-containing protein, partial [Ferruginibacter sp.]
MPTKLLAKTGSIFVALLICCLLSQAQPAAQFTATPLSGCAPVVVQFTDQSTGNPTSWNWDFGDGATSVLRNPSRLYINPGQYTIKLTVQGPGGTNTLIKTNFITVFAPPTVNFSATPLIGCFPLPVQFTDLSLPGSGTNTQWQWDFGDGVSSTMQNPSHTYTGGGNFNVSLKVTNSNGCFKTFSRPNYVQLFNGVNAAFSNSMPSSCTAPLTVNFTNQSTGTGVLNYQWLFGDGSTSTATSPSHLYSVAGVYTVKLIVANATGCRDTITKTNIINVGAAQANFNAPASGCINTPISFLNTSQPAPLSVIWRFGDGTTSTLLNPNKTFTAFGTFQVKLVSSFAGCKDSIIKPITILAKPVAAFTGSPLSSCQAPLTVNFTNTSSGSTGAIWDFGDGSTTTQPNPTHVYLAGGAYTVRLIATNGSGCSDTLIRQQYVNISLPAIIINDLPLEGCTPLSHTFTSSVNTTETIVAYAWDFGDGTTSTLMNPTHVYVPGNYNVQLTITTASGCTNTLMVPNAVSVGVKPTANFVATPLDVCAEIPITFTSLSSGVIEDYSWTFGDGGSSTDANPMYVYTDTGFFDVQLVVNNNGCRDTIGFPKYIHITPPVAIFSSQFDCGTNGNVVFTDLSIAADTWNWDFGDGSPTTTVQHPTHAYTSPGLYNVALTVTNISTGCSYTKINEIKILIASADFSASDTAICKNTSTSFSAAGQSTNIVSYDWLFGDGTNGTGDTISHIYSASGYYDVSLITLDVNGCHDTLTRQQYIRVNGPTANFGVQNSSTCSINAVPLIDSSTNDGVHPITTWIWNYGDGITETLTSGPFSHTYTAAGDYSISLQLIDTEGCRDSILKASLLTISQPIADFTADTISCPGIAIPFENLSTGPGLRYSWTFGDGGTSTAATPTHSYAVDGIYTVKLFIADQYGCSDSIVKNNYIRITTPHASFSVTDTVGTCPPLVVN